MNKNLNRLTSLALFCSSFLPLFLLIIIKQGGGNLEYFHWGGITKDSLLIWFEKFGLSTVSILCIIFGSFGTSILLNNLNRRTSNNGIRIEIIKSNNNNDQFLVYLVTYIIPFVSLGSSSIPDSICTFLLLILLYSIYEKTSLIMINPVLNLIGYNLYKIEYRKYNNDYSKIILIRSSDIGPKSIIRIYDLGLDLLFAIKK